MKTISLFFKVLWSPGETMFLLSKTPRVLAPVLFLMAFSFVTQNVLLTKIDPAEIAIKAAEQQSRGVPLTEDRKQQVRNFVHSPVLATVSPYARSLSTATRAASVVSLFLVYTALRLAYAAILGV